MTREYIRRSGNGNLRCSRTEESLRDAIKRIEINEVGVSVASFSHAWTQKKIESPKKTSLLPAECFQYAE
jgi:hypothetical protein